MDVLCADGNGVLSTRRVNASTAYSSLIHNTSSNVLSNVHSVDPAGTMVAQPQLLSV